MNNEELKKKISEIIQKARNDYSEMTIYDYIADVLIAAGVGDVSSEKAMRELAEAFYREKCAEYDLLNYQMQKSEYRIAEAEHRAARAEKALDLCETAYILSLNHRATEGISGQAIASDLGVHKFFLEQAEKELAEEGKDD